MVFLRVLLCFALHLFIIKLSSIYLALLTLPFIGWEKLDNVFEISFYRYKFTLFNELYFLVAGGTIWIGKYEYELIAL
jgi:hypothetical protein